MSNPPGNFFGFTFLDSDAAPDFATFAPLVAVLFATAAFAFCARVVGVSSTFGR